MIAMRPDGSGIRQLTHGADGRFVVFHGTTTPSFYDIPRASTIDSMEIFIADRDGGNLRQLTRNSRGAVHPSW